MVLHVMVAGRIVMVKEKPPRKPPGGRVVNAVTNPFGVLTSSDEYKTLGESGLNGDVVTHIDRGHIRSILDGRIPVEADCFRCPERVHQSEVATQGIEVGGIQ